MLEGNTYSVDWGITLTARVSVKVASGIAPNGLSPVCFLQLKGSKD